MSLAKPQVSAVSDFDFEFDFAHEHMNGSEALGYLTFVRTYAQSGETYEDTVKRYLNFFITKYPNLRGKINSYGHALFQKKAVGSMRMLQFAGEPVDRDNARAYNCSFTGISSVKDFGDVLYLLCCGCGVGISVQYDYINQLPIVSKGHEDLFEIPDSKEGWGDSVQKLILNPNQQFDYSKIRPVGSPLSTGGFASGPEPLMQSHDDIRKILKGKIGERLSPTDVADIVCLIARCVVAGGVRRSSIIVLFEDDEMLNFKNFDKWWETHEHRSIANVSRVVKRGTKLVEETIDKALNSLSGEPGIMLVNESDINENIGSNPCQPAFAKVFEKTKGLCTFADIDAGSEIWDGKKFVKVLKKWSTGIKEVHEYSTSKGSFIGTDNHPVMSEGKLVEVKDANFIDDVSGPNRIIWTMSRGEHEVFDITVDSDEHLYWTNNCIVHNCGEISLKNKAFCNLCEIIMHNCEDKEDFFYACKAASFFGTLQASLTNFNYISPEWSENAKKEGLLGVSLTGQAMAQHLCEPEILREGARLVKQVNIETAKLLGINPAKRLTTTKPSGSTSCVFGSSSGIHAAYSEYCIRRIRVSKNSDLGKKLMQLKKDLYCNSASILQGNAKYNFIVDDNTHDRRNLVLQFPVKYENAIYRKDESAVDLLERVKSVYQNWVVPGHNEGQETNNVSVTVFFKPDEKEAVKQWMIENQGSYRGISVLPYDCGTYTLTPFEEVDENEWKMYEKNFPAMDWVEFSTGIKSIKTSSVACAGGACEIGSL